MNYIYTQSSNYMFKNLIQKVFDFFISGTNRSVIAICFLMSLLFWFLIKFSKEYTYYIDYPIEFINQPIDKYWKDEPLSNLKVKVNGHGFNFLKETFSNRLLKVDVSKLQNTNSSTYFWLSQAERSNIAIELNGFSILEIYPDTLFINYSKKTKKSVQVKVPLNLNFMENYEQYGSFKILPNTIDVYGPSHILDTLSFVYTNVLNQHDIFQSINSTLKIQLPNKDLSTNYSEVNFIQEVARYTQISRLIPIKLKNVPKGKELRIIPSEVELSYWVAMQDVDKINSSDFAIYCDYNEVDMTENAILNVFIDESKTPSIVQKVKYHPSNIEFIKLN
ncbi:MAG: hypothetical protein CM15mP23_09250 [Cryomorphaceae bacterium]|nr:MAG: hypothetical protein CM15mP23_09250 [Cryomorphaceae bacterium]